MGRVLIILSAISCAALMSGCAENEPQKEAPAPKEDKNVKVISPDEVDEALPKPPSTNVQTCNEFDMHGTFGGEGAGYFDISVRQMSCQEAKPLIVDTKGGSDFSKPASYGFTCKKLSEGYEVATFRCKDDQARAFRFSFGS